MNPNQLEPTLQEISKKTQHYTQIALLVLFKIIGEVNDLVYQLFRSHPRYRGVAKEHDDIAFTIDRCNFFIAQMIAPVLVLHKGHILESQIIKEMPKALSETLVRFCENVSRGDKEIIEFLGEISLHTPVGEKVKDEIFRICSLLEKFNRFLAPIVITIARYSETSTVKLPDQVLPSEVAWLLIKLCSSLEVRLPPELADECMNNARHVAHALLVDCVGDAVNVQELQNIGNQLAMQVGQHIKKKLA